MKPSIVLYKPLSADLHQRLEQHYSVVEFDGINADNRDRVFAALQQAEGLLGSGGPINKELLDHAPRLRGVSTASAGYDSFDVAELTRRGIPLLNAPAALTDTVADLVLGLMLATARRIEDLSTRVKAGEWQSNATADWFGIDVHHKTLGIVGMGRIGMAVAQRAHFGFDMPILYNARSQHKDAETRFAARHCDLDTLLQESDFVCVILPLSDQTFHLIGKEQFAKMKSTGILISAGRGPVIDEQALITALQNGEIYGAGLDVYEKEPLAKDSALLSLPNVVTLPHVGSATAQTRYDMDAAAVENLIAALSGDIKDFCVNPQVLKKA
ncbi:MAG: glyoxylate/hydroxypyruvate reductase GhrB [Rouxiella aceris]|uniref:glyoxylate/hydroxypyruvate reductase GhrB n=1 Tax=Rouxiella aceris TaxID=2703884 RepID=UPI0028492BDE|nr:glyoxylate/hydroxypyruvate reductase GhrB [Rouxiella aceris]MDR3433311.1 glyoxylate/hydroxypyruvate reductase GhrB [Rouxiella aceris]